MSELVKTFAELLKQFAYSVDIVDESTFNRVRDHVVEYMRNAGNVWFARCDEIADHVQALIRAGTWRPRVERIPPYDFPDPEFVQLKKDSGRT